MSTPNETPDPFMSPAPGATSGHLPPVPPAPMAPPGYTQPPPGYAQMAPGGYAPITVAPDVPRTLALWAIILTGAYTAATLLSAVLAPATIDSLKTSFEDPENASTFAGSSPADALTTPLGIASFVVLALWMSRIRGSRKARGEVVGGPPAVEWWGWFVPFANAVLPYLGMRAITKGRVSTGLLLGWWLPYVASSLVGFAAFGAIFGTIDWETGETKNVDSLDQLVGIYWASAGLMIVSWIFLAMIIRITTRREADGV